MSSHEDNLFWYGNIVGGSDDIIVIYNKLENTYYTAKRISYNKKYHISQWTLKEIICIGSIRCDYVISFVDVCFERDGIYIIMPYIKHTLRSLNKKITDRIIVAYQLALGVNYLHNIDIIHGDLKPENILMSENENVYICDFGLSKMWFRNPEPVVEKIYSLWYRAPEILFQEQVNMKTDVWAFGCILFEIFSQRILFSKKSESKQISKLYKLFGDDLKKYYNLPYKFYKKKKSNILKEYLSKHIQDAQLIDLLVKTLEIDPTQRYTMRNVIDHVFFKHEEKRINRILKLKQSTNISSRLNKQSSKAEDTYDSLHILLYNSLLEMVHKLKIDPICIGTALWMSKICSPILSNSFLLLCATIFITHKLFYNENKLIYGIKDFSEHFNILPENLAKYEIKVLQCCKYNLDRLVKNNHDLNYLFLG